MKRLEVKSQIYDCKQSDSNTKMEPLCATNQGYSEKKAIRVESNRGQSPKLKKNSGVIKLSLLNNPTIQ